MDGPRYYEKYNFIYAIADIPSRAEAERIGARMRKAIDDIGKEEIAKIEERKCKHPLKTQCVVPTGIENQIRTMIMCNACGQMTHNSVSQA